jgi:uncharacterized membrane protein YdjX (TVP38/TMEM64 family)
MKKLKLLTIICIILIIIVAYFLNLKHYLSILTLQLYKNELLDYVEHHTFLSKLIFIIIYSVCVGLSLPGAAFLSLAGGFLFGIVRGTLANVIAATVGSIGAFLLARYLLGKSLQKKYQMQLMRFNEELNNYGVLYLFMLRLIPIFPLLVINFLSGLTTISLKTFAVTTFFGIIPGALAFTIAGNSLRTTTSIKEIFTKPFIFAMLLLLTFSLLALWYKKIRKNLST